MKTILITGGAGFVGSNLAIKLKNKYSNYNIISFDNLKRRGSELNLIRLKENEVNFIHGDIRNAEDFKDINQKIDILIDASADPSVLAGITSSVYPLINTNLMGTVNALEFANKNKSKFIFLSTSRIYPINALENANFEELQTRFQWTNNQNFNGISSKGITEDFTIIGGRSFYGATKLASELIINEYFENKQMPIIINRCGVISGPWQMGKVDQGVLVLWLARHFFKKELSYIGFGGTGKQMRDVLHIDDLYNLIDIQIHNFNEFNGQTFNVGGGLESSFSLLELTEYCEKITGNKIKINSIKENRAADIRIYVTDNSKIYNTNSWRIQKTVNHLLADTFDWLKNNENNLKNILN